MVKKIITAALLLVSITGAAQININVQLPPAGMVQKEQLWNLILVNNNTDMQEVILQLTLQDAANGQPVLTATTGSVFLSKGVKLLKVSDIQPINYTYTLPDFAKKFIPIGSYTACYQVIAITNRKETPVAQDCIRLNIDPLSPPLLNYPSDKTMIETAYPQFSWTPPAPLEMFSSLRYDLMVTEVLDGQSPAEAIQYNTPIYTRSNIVQPYESYPSSFSKLDTGKLYAWQVLANNGLSYAVKTEVWTFKIKTPSWIQLLIEQTPFIKMRQDNPEKGIAPNGVLKLSYTNETADTAVAVQVKEINGQSKGEIVFEMKINRGENLLQKDLQKQLLLKDGVIYEATIGNSRGEIWRVLFEVKESKDKKTQRN